MILSILFSFLSHTIGQSFSMMPNPKFSGSTQFWATRWSILLGPPFHELPYSPKLLTKDPAYSGFQAQVSNIRLQCFIYESLITSATSLGSAFLFDPM